FRSQNHRARDNFVTVGEVQLHPRFGHYAHVFEGSQVLRNDRRSVDGGGALPVVWIGSLEYANAHWQQHIAVKIEHVFLRSSRGNAEGNGGLSAAHLWLA